MYFVWLGVFLFVLDVECFLGWRVVCEVIGWVFVGWFYVDFGF